MLDRRPGGRFRRWRGFWASILALSGLGPAWFAEPDGASRGRAIGPYLGGKFPESPPAPGGNWAAIPAFPRLTFEDPIFLVPRPGGGTLQVGGRQGLIWSVADDPNASSKSVFLDLRSRCQGWDDGGLLAMAFHPEFGKSGSPNRGYFYVFYSHAASPSKGPDRPQIDHSLRNRVSRFTLPDGSEAADPNSELVLIDQQDENIWHNGGGLFFHPADGFLYLSLGDEGGDYGNTQRIDKDLFSGVIRIDVDCRGGAISHPPIRQPRTGRTAHYFIPNDNPWVGVPDVLEEFWAIGLRSPHRMTVDPPTGRVWLGDVGESSREEVDIIERGGNYQWNFREGTIRGGERPAKILGSEKNPIHEYSHQEGSAVIGGYVYRGAEHADALGGKYVFGDQSGRISALAFDGKGPARVEPLCDMPIAGNRAYGIGLSSFGVDLKGEIYLCQMGDKGQIFRLGRTGSAGDRLPRRLSETGAFRDLKTLEPSPGLIAYRVNAPLWSDGASKSRWVSLPGGSSIAFSANGEWSFPEGTVFVKHFELADESRPSGKRRLETRFLVRSATGAYGVTYRWRPDGSDADRVDGPAEETLTTRSGPETRKQTWHYPGRSECLACHTPAAGYVLGANSRQWNGPGPESSENQILEWGRLGLLRPAPSRSEVDALPRLSAIDSRADLGQRVRSYLDANCAHCHRPGGVRARLDARFEAPGGPDALIDATVANHLGIADPKAIVAGDPTRSIALRRLDSTDPAIRMPPLASSVVDKAASEAFRSWIASMPAAPQVRLSKPSEGIVLVAGTSIAVEADIVPGGRPIREVEFLQGGQPIGSAREKPYRISWKPPEPGSFSVSARAIDEQGRPTTSGPRTVTVNPPKPREVRENAGFLGDLPWISAENGWGPTERDRSNGETGSGDGHPIAIDGAPFARGLGVHAPSRIRYRLDGKYSAFFAEIGVDDEAGGNGSVVFQILVDGVKLFDSGIVRGRDAPRAVRVDLKGRNELILVVKDAGDGTAADHADWAGARLIVREK